MKNRLFKRILLLTFLLLAVLLAVHFLAPIKTSKPTAASPAVNGIRNAAGKNIIICVLDAGRYDHMGCYGYPRPTTPNIDRLAKDSLVFEQHYSQIPETMSSTISLFQSRYIVPEKNPPDIAEFMAESPSLIAWFKRQGFNTMLFSATPKLFIYPPLAQGFDNLAQVSRSIPLSQGAQIMRSGNTRESAENTFYRPENLLRQINGWLATKPKQSFFAYVHFIQPHIPYDAPKNLKDIFAGKKPPLYWNAPSALRLPGEKNSDWPSALVGSVEETINLYDANMRWADEAVGQLEQALRKAGLFDNTLLIITADHGETLGEHGYNWRTACPYDEALHIPLIMRFPGKDAPTGRIKALTQNIDLLPTLFDILNQPYPAAVQGRSLLPLLAGETAGINDYCFSTASQFGRSYIFIIRDLQSTLMLREDGKTRALYDMVKDPHQTKNIIKSEPARAAKLVEAFRQFALALPDPPLYFIDPAKRWPSLKTNAAPPQTKEMPEELKKRMKTLGYLK